MEQNDNATGFKEAKFEINELFFSITSQDSTILSGNDVFVRISGYAKHELIGSFHNIIRHPDMPRVVFKTFWEYLKADKPIVAYVKNKTKEGGYYWVLAAVFPLKERYVSIRIKPNTQIFTAIKALYFKLLMAESKGGMEESERIMPDLLSELGYKNYDHFMSDALLQELRERQSVGLHTDREIESGSLLKSAYGYSRSLMQKYDYWFEKIEMFTQVKCMFEEKGLLLRHLARDIVFLSLNTSVSSYKVANGGETFGVLARDIRTNAKENDALISKIHAIVQELSHSLNEIVFSVSALRLQVEMVTYFIEELLSGGIHTQTHEMNENMRDLVALVLEYSNKLKKVQLQLAEQIQESLRYLEQLEQQMLYLGYIQIYGIIEAATSHDESARFGVIFSQLKALLKETSKEIETMQKMGKNFERENGSLIEESQEMDKILNHLQEEICN